MGVLITPTYAPFCIRSPEGNLFFLRGEDFSGFSPEPFPGVIAAAVAIITATTTATTTATATLVTTAIAATAIGGTLTKVKILPFGEIFQKVSASISL